MVIPALRMIFSKYAWGIPLSCLVNPGRFLVQSPIECIGSRNRKKPPGFKTRNNSFNTYVTFGIWCNVEKHVIKSTKSFGKSIFPFSFTFKYTGVVFFICLLRVFFEASTIYILYSVDYRQKFISPRRTISQYIFKTVNLFQIIITI